MVDIDKTDWTPNRKIVAQAAAMLALFVTGAAMLLAGVEPLPIPLGIETALAVVIGYFIPNKTRTVTTVEHTTHTQVIDTEKDDPGPDPDLSE